MENDEPTGSIAGDLEKLMGVKKKQKKQLTPEQRGDREMMALIGAVIGILYFFGTEYLTGELRCMLHDASGMCGMMYPILNFPVLPFALFTIAITGGMSTPGGFGILIAEAMANGIFGAILGMFFARYTGKSYIRPIGVMILIWILMASPLLFFGFF